MMDFLFFVKTVAATVALIVLIQLKIGSASIENHAVMAFQGSMIAQPLNDVAQGGAKMIRELVDTVHGKINSKFGTKESNSKKTSGFRFSWDS